MLFRSLSFPPPPASERLCFSWMAPKTPKPPKEKFTTSNGVRDENPFASGPPKRPPPARKQNIVRSGNAGNSGTTVKPALAPGEVAPPPPLFRACRSRPSSPCTLLTSNAAPGYKTPLSLLTERCQKSGWEKPSVDPKKAPSGLWTASVTLRRKNAKTNVFETVYMRPPPDPSPICVEKATAMEAK